MSGEQGGTELAAQPGAGLLGLEQSSGHCSEGTVFLRPPLSECCYSRHSAVG